MFFFSPFVFFFRLLWIVYYHYNIIRYNFYVQSSYLFVDGKLIVLVNSLASDLWFQKLCIMIVCCICQWIKQFEPRIINSATIFKIFVQSTPSENNNVCHFHNTHFLFKQYNLSNVTERRLWWKVNSWKRWRI